MLVVSEISRFTCIHMLLVFISEYPTVGPPTIAQLSPPLYGLLPQFIDACNLLQEVENHSGKLADSPQVYSAPVSWMHLSCTYMISIL